MNNKLKLAIAIVAGAALILLKRRHEKHSPEITDENVGNPQKRSQPNRPPGYRPLKDLSLEEPDIVALQNTSPAAAPDRHRPLADVNKEVAYHPKGNRHH